MCHGNLKLVCSHIHRDGNHVADALAKNGQGLPCFATEWWDFSPLFILPLLFRDSSCRPIHRTMLS